MSQERVNPTENTKLLLFSEVGGVCPRCPNGLMYKKNGRDHKRFEVAHIYPINPTKAEELLLRSEEKLNEDLNHIDNLICLCVDCHTKFDKPRTVEDYQLLVETKKRLIQQFEQKRIWGKSSLEEEILEIIKKLADEDFVLDVDDTLNYDPKSLDQKLDSSVTMLTKRKVHHNVQDYYFAIREQFKELDRVEPTTSEIISNQIKGHYLQLTKLDSSYTQKEVFDAMVNWLAKHANQCSGDACEIVISYFIQNCEIFE